MVNTTFSEFQETKAPSVPSPSLETLISMREDLCSSSSAEFRLQPSQRFLRRVLSPDSPTRCLLMVHGAGAGKTCTAIQIAEEYVIRPEFQDKRVLVLANPTIQENFRNQIFDITRVSIDKDGLVLSKQCTGRRYLDMIQRYYAEPTIFTDKTNQQRVARLTKKIIDEFYEFQGYFSFAESINKKKEELKTADYELWVHETFDNRLLIIDEAHILRDTSEGDTTKLFPMAIEDIVKTANGITLVLLTATPMYDTFEELIYYFNLFLWNEKKQGPKEYVKSSDIFHENGDFKDGGEPKFRSLCQDYVSFVQGGNPFTFPFRLSPPETLIAKPQETDIFGKKIQHPRKYLTLTQSIVSPTQQKAIQNLRVTATIDPRIICAFPENKGFRETFQKVENVFQYRDEKFLAPSKIAEYSSKFALIMDTLKNTKGVAFVFSNLAESGAQLFSMCLEEHGYESAVGARLLQTSGEVARGSSGKYVLFTSNTPPSDITKALNRLRSSSNVHGDDIRVIVASPKVAEGVDFRFVRQVHVIDPWFNMSRIEQVIGRGIRTCSHSLLPFKEQNCTVYLHVCKYPDSTQETLDEYIYRVFVEEKGRIIAKVKRVVMESAMDCSLQQNANELPIEWKQQHIPQIRNEDNHELNLTLQEMSAPTFEDGTPQLSCKIEEHAPDPNHVRPLSSILDVRDEIINKLVKLFIKKTIWSKNDLFAHPFMKQYDEDTLSFILQQAIQTRVELKDSHGRIGHLETRKNMFALMIDGHDTMVERLISFETGRDIPLEQHEVVEEVKKPKITKELPAFVDKFSDEIKEWYIVDSLSPDEKVRHMLDLDWSNPPIYAKPLKITVSDGTELYVLGSKKIYNQAKELITPIGAQETAYRDWITKSKDAFVERRNQLFASVKDGEIIFNLDDKSSEVKRGIRSKNIGGRVCMNYKEPLMTAFIAWLGESGEIKRKIDRCIFLGFAVRSAIAKGREGIFWVTPEEFEIYNEDEHRLPLVARVRD